MSAKKKKKKGGNESVYCELGVGMSETIPEVTGHGRTRSGWAVDHVNSTHKSSEP